MNTTPREFQIRPTNKEVIEWQLSSGRWGFFRVCDSPADAKRSLAAILGQATEPDPAQAELFDNAAPDAAKE